MTRLPIWNGTTHEDCSTCRFWRLDYDDDFAKTLLPRRECRRFTRETPQAAVLCMAEGGIGAELFTAPEFSCLAWEHRTPEVLASQRRDLCRKHLGAYFSILGYTLRDVCGLYDGGRWRFKDRGRQLREELAKAEEFGG